MAFAHVSPSLCLPIHYVTSSGPGAKSYALPGRLFSLAGVGSVFATGSPLLIGRRTCQRKFEGKTAAISIRCEQSTKDGNGLDVWLGRLAMIGFAVAITVEVATGKGLLENFGLTAPLPTVALGVTALAGVLTAIFIFQSSSEN